MNQPLTERQALVDEAVEDFVNQAGEPPHLVLAKSVGTLAAGWVADHSVPAIWTTPLLDDESVGEHTSRIVSYSSCAGSQDHTWDDDGRQTGKPVHRISGVDHGWHTGDWRTELDAVCQLTEVVEKFVSTLTNLSADQPRLP